MRKAPLACGSMVLYLFVWYFSPGRAKNTRQRVKIRALRKSKNKAGATAHFVSAF
jgi:hypothetical protein